MPRHYVVIDTRVIYHKIAYGLIETQYPYAKIKQIIQAQLAWVQSGLWCQEELGPTVPVWVDDAKIAGAYWRHLVLQREAVWSQVPGKPRAKRSEKKRQKYLALKAQLGLSSLEVDLLVNNRLMAQGYVSDKATMPRDALVDLALELRIAYKGGRSYSRYDLKRVIKVGSALIPQWGNYLNYPRYEADDMASLLVRSRPHGAKITLLTIDSDWMGLIAPRVQWVCAKGYYPRVRKISDGSMNYWLRKKLGTEVSEPREIWDLKNEQGDASDNLPPGSPLGVIDLLNPLPGFDLYGSEFHRDKVLPCFDGPMSKPELGERARKFLAGLGVSLVVRELSPEDRFNPMAIPETIRNDSYLVA
jgi:hypothetical protein